MFRVNSGTSAIDVPAADGKMRLWRNTSIASLAPNDTATLTGGTLGMSGTRHPTTASDPGLVTTPRPRGAASGAPDFGSTYASGTATTT
jgi:hypothetical protein